MRLTFERPNPEEANINNSLFFKNLGKSSACSYHNGILNREIGISVNCNIKKLFCVSLRDVTAVRSAERLDHCSSGLTVHEVLL